MIPKLNEFKNRWHFKSEADIKLGLGAIENALKKLGHPERTLQIIHVSGTNGKGSTIQMMEAILQAHQYTTGSFTSPAIKDMYDQIRYNGQNVTSDQIDKTFQQMNAQNLSGTLTDFELLTVIAFLVFEALQLDYVFIETGMGGLQDSTNVVTPIASVMTSIALDHTQFLGTTIEEITAHKAGIIKKEVPIIVGDLPEEALPIVKKMAAKKHAPLKVYGEDFNLGEQEGEIFIGTSTFTLPERKMKGRHQRINTSIAIEALLSANIELKEACIQKALANTQLAHRFEEILPDVFLDGAHNPAAARALRETIEEEFPGEKVDFIIGMLKGKDIRGTIDALIPVARTFTFIQFDHPDAATVEELLGNCKHDKKQVTKRIDGSIILNKEKGVRLIVTGSLYFLANLSFKIAY